MIYIAHRGLIHGPDSKIENNPVQIKKALDLGYDCEIDFWSIDNQYYLGHDTPDYKINWEFLEQPGLWIHAKNLDALYILTAQPRLNFFWHQNDDYVITSQQYIWTYPGKPITPQSILVMPEWHNPSLVGIDTTCLGICSDYIEKIKFDLEK